MCYNHDGWSITGRTHSWHPGCTPLIQEGQRTQSVSWAWRHVLTALLATIYVHRPLSSLVEFVTKVVEHLNSAIAIMTPLYCTHLTCCSCRRSLDWTWRFQCLTGSRFWEYVSCQSTICIVAMPCSQWVTVHPWYTQAHEWQLARSPQHSTVLAQSVAHASLSLSVASPSPSEELITTASCLATEEHVTESKIALYCCITAFLQLVHKLNWSDLTYLA